MNITTASYKERFYKNAKDAVNGIWSVNFLTKMQQTYDMLTVATETDDLCVGCKSTERLAYDSAEDDCSLRQASYAALSMLRRSVSDSEIHLLAGAGTPDPTVRHGHGCSSVRATTSSLATIHDSEIPSGVYKNTGKPTIDCNFFKSMARTIKANRAAKADTGVVDEEACTDYTGYYTSNSCGQKSHYVNWIEGDAMRMRIELKVRLIHERMIAANQR